MQVPIGVEDNTPAYSMRVFTVIPAGHTPYHEHPFEHINYVISGEGVINTEDGPFWITKGDCILIPANIKHNYENIMGDVEDRDCCHDLVFVCLVPKEYECGCPDDQSGEEGTSS
jgi:gentisate 1,2-dioxygenase